MGIIGEDDKKEIEKIFNENLADPVTLVVFVDDKACRYCEETRQICEELGETSSKITVEVYNLTKDVEAAGKYGIERAPAIAIIGKEDYGVRYYGIPAGYEFTSVVEDIIDISRGTTDLKDKTKEKLTSLDRDIHIQVFVTPSCPYCPMAVRTAHKMAIESPRIRADMVEATEFPDLSSYYEVMAVPKIIINEDTRFEGALPEKLFLDKVLSA
ncbi:MAG: thioredoxin family protein [Thermoplasmata archaeon]|nr:thioredoxin family protein [Thermoplasmata archaeon]